ncbi:MAG: transglutaminase domain-containing protein, partial [Acetobacteraceae bacterium]|nr:transglutaminase domain-containing protein [Acetobacteraceae bacterium]
DEVLRQGYGDCKDQAVLLIALSRAKGIEAEPVLINLTPSYPLSGPPTYSAFNHLIAYVPQLGVYMDTTAGGAPFGTLRPQEYGKPILRVTRDGSAPGQLPPMPPGLATQQLRTTITLQKDGRMSGIVSPKRPAHSPRYYA